MTDGKAGRVPDYLDHIIDAINRIEKYTLGLNHHSFVENDMAHNAVIRQFEVIGEAARRIITSDPGFTARYPTMELDGAYRMRNALAHGYDSVNLRTVWDTIEDRLPALKAEAVRVRGELSVAGPPQPGSPESDPAAPSGPTALRGGNPSKFDC